MCHAEHPRRPVGPKHKKRKATAEEHGSAAHGLADLADVASLVMKGDRHACKSAIVFTHAFLPSWCVLLLS